MHQTLSMLVTHSVAVQNMLTQHIGVPTTACTNQGDGRTVKKKVVSKYLSTLNRGDFEQLDNIEQFGVTLKT